MDINVFQIQLDLNEPLGGQKGYITAYPKDNLLIK